MRGRTTTRIVFAVTALSLVGAPAADADTNLGSFEGTEYFSDVVVGSTGAGAVRVDCPAGTKLVGGGGRASGGPTTGRVNSIHPVDGTDGDGRPDDGFRAKVWSTTGGVTGAVFAVCQAGASPSYRSATGTLPAMGSADKRAKCPSDTHVSGGGATVGGRIDRAFLNSSFPADGGDEDADPDDGWKVRVQNLSDSARHFTVHATCRPSLPIYLSQVTSVDAGFAAGAVMACQAPYSHGATLGGGVQFTGTASEAVFSLTTPFDSSDMGDTPDDAWYVEVRNTVSTKTMTRYAICEP